MTRARSGRRPGRRRRGAAGRARRRQPRPDRDAVRRERHRQRASELADRRATRDRYRRLGSRRGQRRRFAGRILYEATPEPVELSTGCLEAAYPFQTASPTPTSQGMAVGPSPTGGVFAWDPWTLYHTGRLSNPNVLLIGDVGAGKSALAKTLVWRGLEFGRGAHILDPKGEYRPLAEASGSEPIALRPGGTTTLNPLDPGAAGSELAPSELFHRNLATARALLEATLGRACTQLEMVLLAGALAQVCRVELSDPSRPLVTRHGQIPTLPMLAEALVDPPTDVARRVNLNHGRVVEESREMALALARLVDPNADLGGMFAGHTNIDTDALSDVVVVDLSAWRTHRAALPLVMICTAAWLQLATSLTARGRFQINDEAWALLADEATARWMQTNQKLARQLSLSVINIMHRLSDTAATGDAGTSVRSLAEGVIADAGTWIIYRQKPSERPLLHDTLQLNDVQVQLATSLPRGRGLWIVGGETRQVCLVDHVLSPTEKQLTDTDASLRAAQAPRPTQPAG